MEPTRATVLRSTLSGLEFESLQFREQIHRLMTVPKNASSFTVLLELALTQAMELLHLLTEPDSAPQLTAVILLVYFNGCYTTRPVKLSGLEDGVVDAEVEFCCGDDGGEDPLGVGDMRVGEGIAEGGGFWVFTEPLSLSL
ncbi:hypothetical protein ACFX2K_013127 [Malus domestica]